MGTRRIVRAPGPGVTRGQAQVVRLVLVCAAWAVGETAALAIGARSVDVILAAVLALGVYVLTMGLGRPRFDGDAKYWRGRRIDGDRR